VKPSQNAHSFSSLSTDLLELLFTQLPVGVAWFDTRFNLVRCNPAFALLAERFTPLTPDQIVPGISLAQLSPGKEAFFQPDMQRVLRGETLRVESFRAESGGMTSYWDGILAPILKDGKVIAILDIIADVTDRALAIQQERESQAALQSLVTNAHRFALYRLEADRSRPYGARVLFVSPSLREIFGVDDPQRLEIWFDAIHPEDLAKVRDAHRRSVHHGEPYNQIARIFNKKRREWAYIHIFSTPFFNSLGRLSHIDGMIIDLTDQITMQEAERRWKVAEGLRDVLRMINSSQPLQNILQAIARQAKQWLQADSVMIRQVSKAENCVRTVAACDLPADFDVIRETPFYQGMTDQALMHGDVVIIEDIPAVYQPHLAHTETDANSILTAGLSATVKYYHSLLKTPLFVHDNIFGAITFHFIQPRKFSDEDIALARMLSDQATLAIENARLLQDAEQRRNVAESLRDTLSILNTERPLQEILEHIVAQAQHLLQAKAVAVHRLDADNQRLIPEASVGLSPDYISNVHLPIGQGALGKAVLTREPVQVNDTSTVFSGSAVRTSTGEPVTLEHELTIKLQSLKDRYGAVLAVPMVIKSQIYGGLALYYAVPRNFQPEEVQLAVTFADQASLAIENAMLRTQAAEIAALSERNRLARELHDAVSQTLFSTTLTAEVLPRIWEKNPDEGRKKLDELRELTRGALAEMRTLLVELRPTAMQEAELNDLLHHLANAFIARARVPLHLTIEGQCEIPLEVKIAFYRVAQEALHNIAKHADAAQVALRLIQTPQQIHLEVRDDGIGFVLDRIRPDHFGLGIMRERAVQVGADLKIESQPGQGACITMRWKSGNTS
jgi:signal transduction histidine kinase/PAS domain-containing protein